MGYRIEYDRGNGKYEVREEHPYRFVLLLGVLVFSALLASCFLPNWTAAVRSVLIPGDDAVTVQAFECMTDDLRSGAKVFDAVKTFCRFVIHGQ